MVCNPYLTVLTFLLENMSTKKFFMISGDELFNFFYISVARVLEISFMDCDRFVFTKSFSNDEKRSF